MSSPRVVPDASLHVVKKNTAQSPGCFEGEIDIENAAKDFWITQSAHADHDRDSDESSFQI